VKLTRANDAPPPLPDEPLIVFDGVCVLCSRFARFVIEHDTDGVFRFTTAQGELGQALFRHYGLSTTEFETNIVIADRQAWGELDAFAQVMARLPQPWRWLRLVRWIPEPLSGWLYRRIALNRYRLFGKTDTCMVPPADWRDRFIA
jgi:predicted DCC family thiol-disulfide oxidoreductase YuxK